MVELNVKGCPMVRTSNLFVILLLFVFLCVVWIPNNVSSQDKSGEFWRLVKTVQDILAGKNVEQTKTTIAEGARLIYGTKFEDLKGVVAGEIRTCSLADESYQGVMMNAKTNPSEDMGFLTLKTQTPDKAKVRFHTVVFMKDSTGEFKIHSWHTADCDQ